MVTYEKNILHCHHTVIKLGSYVAKCQKCKEEATCEVCGKVLGNNKMTVDLVDVILLFLAVFLCVASVVILAV